MQIDVEIRLSFHGRKIFAKEPEFVHVAVLFFSVVCKVLHSERTWLFGVCVHGIAWPVNRLVHFAQPVGICLQRENLMICVFICLDYFARSFAESRLCNGKDQDYVFTTSLDYRF